ncbi:hypothetical protein [Nonomuraea jiangxiensis]|uniref:COG1470 family protein n=1 Tax=Nonomuraea jiangxiensis TaxID=633440 RepID=UPI00115FF9E6|nr:hypothetical protein [Nonomuraea jiangxiensis]
MPFELDLDVEVEYDERGIVRGLEHLERPYPGSDEPDPRRVAARYVDDVAHIYHIPGSMLTGLWAPVGGRPVQEPTRLRFAEEKSLTQATIVAFVQTALSLPIWEAGLSVSLLPDPLRVVGSQSSVHLDVDIQAPDDHATYLPTFPAKDLAWLLGLRAGPQAADRLPEINASRLLVYRYHPAARFDPETEPVLPLPEVSGDIVAGRHYVVREVLFTWPVPGAGDVHWRAFVEVETGGVLYLRAALAAVQGFVYPRDPVTTGGRLKGLVDELDARCTFEDLLGLKPADPQTLSGDLVRIVDSEPPHDPPPSTTTGVFKYPVDSRPFAAVNAYHHVDRLFRLVQDLGFDLGKLFDGTIRSNVSVPVDHCALNDLDNAYALGNDDMTGLKKLVFGRSANTGVSLANDARVVTHEFCHALLWDAVQAANLSFAHSPGDALAAVLNDPGSKAPDRYHTFPWTGRDRHHGGTSRQVADGWAWDGLQDGDSEYSNEQILSATVFGLYLSIGGASTDVRVQTWASRYAAYLIIGGIASLETAKYTSASKANAYAKAMMLADATPPGYDGLPGALRKVVRWSFEQRGLYKAPGTPLPDDNPGVPREVDVYIDDGRQGEYAYQGDFWESTDVWNRLAADGGSAHQTPRVNAVNHAYVRVGNRGTGDARNVTVRGFHCGASAGLVWPDDWKPMGTPSITVPGPIGPGHSMIVGPFSWTPVTTGHDCLLMSVSAPGDRANDDPSTSLASAKGPTPLYRIVPFDNNIAQRAIAPVAGGGGATGLTQSLQGRRLRVHNPYPRASDITVQAGLPDFLRRRGWNVTLAGGATFRVAARAGREVTLVVRPGGNFTAGDVAAAGSNVVIRLRTLIDGLVVGGMSFTIDPALHGPAPER